MIDRNTNTPLTLDDIAEILANVNDLEEETMTHLAHYIKSDPRLQPTIAELMQLLRVAFPQEGEVSYLTATAHCLRDLEALLAHDEWQHPREVLKDPTHCIEYEAMIRILAAWAERAGDPKPFLKVKEKLEAAHAILDDLERLTQSLGPQPQEGLWFEIEERLLELRSNHHV